MPVSGNEETGIKPVTWKSSDYIAGVPIKKRRFPMMRPPSPPPEEPSFPPSKMDSVHKEQSSQSQGLTISNASVATSSGISDTTRVPESDDRRGSADVTNVNVVQGNDNFVRVKLEQPSLGVHLGSADDMRRKGNFVLADNHAPMMTLGRSELGTTEVPVASLSMGIMLSKHNAEVKCKEEMPAIAESTELSLGLKERCFPALTGQKRAGGVSPLNQDKLEPISLNLSLSKERISSQCKSKDRDLSVHGTQMQACRANWDLNTPMDAWGDFVDDASVSADRISTKGGSRAVSSTGMVDGGVSSEKQSDVESHKRTNVTVSSHSNDSLLLRLNSSCSRSNLCQRPSSSSIGFDMERVVSAANLPTMAGPTSNLNLGNHRTVKPEPFDVRIKQEPSNLGSLDSRAGKHGVVERFTVGAIKSSNMSTQKLVDPRSIKSEPAIEVNQETSKSTKGKSVQLDKHVINGMDNHSCDMKLPVAAEISRPAGKSSCLTELTGKHSCSTELTMSGDMTNQSGDFCGKLPHEACQSIEKVATSLGHDVKVNSMQTDDDNVDSQSCKLKLMNDQALDSRGSGEGSASDEEKINISTDMLEDSYGSDYESDGNHAINTAMETEREGKDDDYEDGEVRDLLVDTAVQDELLCEAREVEHSNHDDSDNKRTEFVGPLNNVHHASFHVEAKDNKTDNLAETSNNDHIESSDLDLNSKSDKGSDKDVFLQEALAVEKLTSSDGLKKSINTMTTEPLDDQSGKRDSQKCDAELSSDQVTIGSKGTVVAFAQDTELNVNKTEPVLTSDSTLSKTSGSGDNATKDTSNGGQRSRIITLPRSSNGSPTRSRSIGRSFPSSGGREILPDATPDDDKLHPRGRGETYVDNTCRFSRERYQDQSWRNSRLNFRRGRGRINTRGDWCSERYFASEHYYNQTKYRVPRHKYVNDVSDGDLDYNNYNMASDGAFVGTGRGGRKLSNDGPINHRILPRRRSPIGGHVIHMPRRNPRNISPSRCIGEDTSALVGMRHNEKFMRGFPDDSVDPMFNRTQPSYEGDGHFGRGRGNRTFSFVQRRGIRVRSKSPIRSRTRSPGPWSSPRRRSPDGFGGPGELSHRRSPPNYRMQRFRSPDGASFTGEMVVRRNPSNDLRDMDTGRDHGHQRSAIHNRSPSRILLRNRRFEDIDPRERVDSTDFFAGGPMHSGRLHELGGDGNGEERRRFGERRGPVRTFRPPYNSADGETFHLNTEDGPRPFRFCPDGETEFQERGNLRERDFDRRIKNRPGNAPRRMRSIEDQEGNFRHDGQPWNDSGFDDISQVKRKRF